MGDKGDKGILRVSPKAALDKWPYNSDGLQ